MGLPVPNLLRKIFKVKPSSLFIFTKKKKREFGKFVITVRFSAVWGFGSELPV